MTHDVFISHSSKDKQAADAICHALESSGIKCWIAPRDVNPGFEYAEEIMNGIKSCKIFLLIFSRESNESKPVSKELENAFRNEKTVIPYRIEAVEMRASLEYYLSNLHWIDAFPNDKEFNSLVEVVKNTLSVVAPKPAPEPAPAPPPAPVQQYAPPPVQQYAPPLPPIQPAYMAPNMAAARRTPVGAIVGITAAVVCLIIVGIVLFFAFGGGGDAPEEFQRRGASDDSPFVQVSSQDSPLTPAQIFENNKWAVVLIRGTCAYGDEYTGSGFFISSSGIAVTNHHVMDGLLNAAAILYDGSEYKITGYYTYDIENDLAVIQVDGGNKAFDFVTLGDSDKVSVGDNVYAIGGPDWDPITFTDGMVSRMAYESLNYGNYSVSGMFQSTAAIYGGNSGGPLVDDYGRVIGINSAGRPDRPSVQYAVPVNRISIPSSNAAVQTLPIGGVALAHVPGQTIYFSFYPFIPDFLSVSRNTSLILSGIAIDMDFDYGGLYEYVYIYELPERYFVYDTDEYDELLMNHGFIFQDVVHYDEETWVYLYHPGRDISVSYCSFIDFDMLMIAIGWGNAYETFYGDTLNDVSSVTAAPPSGAPSPGNRFYAKFPLVLDYGAMFPSQFVLEGVAEDVFGGVVGFGGSEYILEFEYVYAYDVTHADAHNIDTYIELLQTQVGFELLSSTVYDAENTYAAVLIREGETIMETYWVSVIYWYDFEELAISIV
jgi:hypothetical protein